MVTWKSLVFLLLNYGIMVGKLLSKFSQNALSSSELNKSEMIKRKKSFDFRPTNEPLNPSHNSDKTWERRKLETKFINWRLNSKHSGL